ncbi:MAG: outer membrane beta-barrel protein [Candidatus Goldiibacteriota bacterium]
MKRILVIFTMLLVAAAVYAAPQAVRGQESAYDIDYWIVSVKGGLSYPLGEFGEYVNPLFNAGVSGRKGLDMEFSVGGGLHYASMPYVHEDAPGPFTATIFDVHGAWQPYMPDLFIWPYLKAGLGMYVMEYSRQVDQYNAEHASETAIGFLAGIGANYPIGDMFAANIEILYHHVALAGGTGDLNTFLSADIGATIYLK